MKVPAPVLQMYLTDMAATPMKLDNGLEVVRAAFQSKDFAALITMPNKQVDGICELLQKAKNHGASGLVIADRLPT